MRPLLLTLVGMPSAQADLAELITVTPDSGVVTWSTAVAVDSTICVDDRPCEAQEQGTRYHRAVAAGLEPGSSHTYTIENGASKEYPGGYSVFDVYEGGYTRSYVRPKECAFCREWTQTTSAEFFGLAPQYLLGSVGTRNFTHVYGCDAKLPPPSLPGTESLVTGGVVRPPARCLDRVRPAGVLEPDEGGGLGASFTLTRRTAGCGAPHAAACSRCAASGPPPAWSPAVWSPR